MLTFAGLLASQIKRISKSLCVEVSRFVERFFGPGLDYSKQAYYKDGQYRSWQGYLLLAGDSSTLQLPLSRELAAALARWRTRKCFTGGGGPAGARPGAAGQGQQAPLQINRAVALGLVKDKLVGLLLGTQPMETAYERRKNKNKAPKGGLSSLAGNLKENGTEGIHSKAISEKLFNISLS